MNKRIIEPLVDFLTIAEAGIYMCDFQFKHINYASSEIASCINAGINYNNTTFVVEVYEES